mgnify:CR=1 FL=1
MRVAVVASNLSNSGGSASAATSRVPIEALRFYDRARLLPAEIQGLGVAGTVPPQLERRLRFSPRQVILVTYDPDRRELVAVQ